MDNKPQKPWWEPGLTVFAEVTGWIAIPIIIALFLGRWLDEKFHKEPWFFLSLTAAAFAISCIGIVTIAGKYIRQIEEESRKKKINNNLKTENIKEDERRNQHHTN